MNEDSLGSADRGIPERLNTVCIGMTMREEYGYQEMIKTGI
jgi:hypothetical protein